jgi:hypothetical protein
MDPAWHEQPKFTLGRDQFSPMLLEGRHPILEAEEVGGHLQPRSAAPDRARQAHNLKVIGSNPIPATKFPK